MKKKDLVFLSVLFALSVSFSLFSQEKTENIIIGERITIKSEILDEERTVLVYLPEEYKSGSQRFPVLYVLDVDMYYYPALGAAKFLSDTDISSPMIIVAIWNTDRTKEMTPTIIARVTSHIPDKGQVMVRYYGLYSNAHRGKMRKVGAEPPHPAYH